MRKLEEEGYVRVRKEFQDRKPATWYSLTSQGRSGLKAHLAAIKKLINGSEAG
jgi:DNA-binding PadR family transcriptional regulator